MRSVLATRDGRDQAITQVAGDVKCEGKQRRVRRLNNGPDDDARTQKPANLSVLVGKVLCVCVRRAPVRGRLVCLRMCADGGETEAETGERLLGALGLRVGSAWPARPQPPGWFRG